MMKFTWLLFIIEGLVELQLVFAAAVAKNFLHSVVGFHKVRGKLWEQKCVALDKKSKKHYKHIINS